MRTDQATPIATHPDHLRTAEAGPDPERISRGRPNQYVLFHFFSRPMRNTMMPDGHAWLTRSAAATLVTIGWGCGSDAPPVDTSTTEATVKGIVTIRSKPVSEGTISFDPSNMKRKSEPVRNAKIGKDGSYTIKTLVGRNNVSVSTPVTDKDPVLQYNSFSFDVANGDNTYAIEVSARQ